MTNPATNRWRTVDIVVASIIAVAFGVVFWAWDSSGPPGRSVRVFPPAQALLYGVWLLPAVLGGPDHPQAGRGVLHRGGRRDRLGAAG